MTHDELLKRIESKFIVNDDGATQAGSTEFVLRSALRAVVELHKLCDMRCDGGQHIADSDGNVAYIPGEKDCTQCMGCEYDYPCRTIQAIEKELA